MTFNEYMDLTNEVIEYAECNMDNEPVRVRELLFIQLDGLMNIISQALKQDNIELPPTSNALERE